jgi:hypothetical protein
VENCPHSTVTVCTEDVLVPLLELMMPSVEVDVEYNQRSRCKTCQQEPETTKNMCFSTLMVVDGFYQKLY